MGGRGQTAIKLVVTDEEGAGEPLFEKEAVITFPNPLAVAELTYTTTRLEFREPGFYRLQLFGAGQLLREYRLLVAQPGQVTRQPR